MELGTNKKKNISTAVRGASVQCAEKYSVSVRRNEMLEVLQSEGHQYNVRKYTVKVCEKMKCLRIQYAGRYSVCTQVTKYAERNSHHAKIRC